MSYDVFTDEKIAIPNVLNDTTATPPLNCASAFGIVSEGVGATTFRDTRKLSAFAPAHGVACAVVADVRNS